MLKRPKKVIRRGHKQGAILNRIAFITAQGRMGIFLCDAIEALDKSLDARRDSSKVCFSYNNHPISIIALNQIGIWIILYHSDYKNKTAAPKAEVIAEYLAEEPEQYLAIKLGRTAFGGLG